MELINISTSKLKQLMKLGQAEIIDIREPEEFEMVRLKNSKLIPMKELKNRVNEINWEKAVVFVCRVGARSKRAILNLPIVNKGIYNLEGGIRSCYYQSDDCIEGSADSQDIDDYFT